MLKLICGLVAVMLSVSGTLAFGDTQPDPEISLPTFSQIMTLTPMDRRAYLEEVQNILVILAEQSERSGSQMVAGSEAQKITIARYNMILALLEAFPIANAQDAPDQSILGALPVATPPAKKKNGVPLPTAKPKDIPVVETIGTTAWGGYVCQQASSGKCTQWSAPGATYLGKGLDVLGQNSAGVGKVDPVLAGKNLQAVDDKICTEKAQKSAIAQNRSAMKSRIYAGNFLPYEQKKPASAFCVDSNVDMTKDPTKCASEQKVVCKGSGQIMCNPLAFGTVSAVEGICISPGGTATKNCAAASKARKQPAFDFLANAKGPITEAWAKYAKDFNSACTAVKGAKPAEMGKALAQCSECGIMATGMKSLNGKYKDKLFHKSTDMLDSDLSIDGTRANPARPRDVKIPSGSGTTTGH